jgi:hypothetical protein
MADSRTMVLQKTRETKNTIRYDHQGDRGVVAVPAIYILKEHIPSPSPRQVKVTVEFLDD